MPILREKLEDRSKHTHDFQSGRYGAVSTGVKDGPR